MAEKLIERNESAVDREIVFTRVFDAPRTMVWEAWTDPKQLVLWWGPRCFTTTIDEMDLRPGGVWKLVMHGPDGTDYPNKSIFTEVVLFERLRFRLSGGKRGGPAVRFEMTATFEDDDDKTPAAHALSPLFGVSTTGPVLPPWKLQWRSATASCSR